MVRSGFTLGIILSLAPPALPARAQLVGPAAAARLPVAFVGNTSGAPGVAGGGGSSADLVSEDCEGTGRPSGWTLDTGSDDWDCTSSPCPLVGSQSLSLGTGGSAVSKRSLGNVSEVWCYFQFRFVSSVQNSTLLFELQDSSGNAACQVDMTANNMRINCPSGSVMANTSTGLSADTTYHFWLHYQKGAGANDDTAELKFSTTGTEPASGSATTAKVTTGSTDKTVDRFVVEMLFPDSPIVVKFDKFRCSSTGDLGDNPP